MAVRPRHRESWRRCCSARLALWGFLWVDTAGFERTLATRRDLAVSLRRLGATCWGDRRTGTDEDGPILQTSALPLGYGAASSLKPQFTTRSARVAAEPARWKHGWWQSWWRPMGVVTASALTAIAPR